MIICDIELQLLTYMCRGIQHNVLHFPVLQFKDVETGEELPDQLDNVKFSSMSWTHDHKGIFYNVI